MSKNIIKYNCIYFKESPSITHSELMLIILMVIVIIAVVIGLIFFVLHHYYRKKLASTTLFVTCNPDYISCGKNIE